MKHFLTTICLLAVMLLATSNISAQDLKNPSTVSVTGGYSWINGVVGAEAQFGNWSVSGGWMPAKMPMSGDKINSMGLGLTYYSLKAGELGGSGYISLGFASAGYRYEDSWGDESTSPMTIVMIGGKYDSGGFYSKAGVGYGWCSDPDVGAFTFELLLGFTLFGTN